MEQLLIVAITWFRQIIMLLLMIRAILSWFARNPGNTIGRINQVAIRLTEPIVEPCRKLMSKFNTGMFDFSVLIAFFLVDIGARLLIMLVSLIF
ncbi:MAG: YggT family protein [Peptostreptococcaceae bacterium]|nr:YggT family protein [Peptostreptococcaceae bacterium]